jgi:predicted kinase
MHLAREALLALERYGGVLVDATCRSRAIRAELIGRLRDGRTKLLIVRCEVPLALALERAERRLRDPGRVSDATPELVQSQFTDFEELDERAEGAVLRLGTDQALDAQLDAVASAVDLVLRQRGAEHAVAQKARGHAEQGA